MTSKSKMSPAIFAASILCFLLPFVTISCGTQKVATFSGVQLATGTTVNQPQMFGPRQNQKVDPNPAAAAAALCAVLALGLSFLGTRIALGPAISGAAGAVSLFLMKSRLDDQIVKQGQGMLQVNYETGFSLALLLLIGGAAWNAYLFSQRNKILGAAQFPAAQSAATRGDPEESSRFHSPNLMQRPPSPTFCPDCGEPWTANAKFCTKCGKTAGYGAAITRA